MKTFCYTDTLLPAQYVLDSNVDGISYALFSSQLFGINGEYNISVVKDLQRNIKEWGTQYNKKTTIQVRFGNCCGNAIYNNFPFLQFTRKHHQNPQNPPVPIKIPVPFNEQYLDEVWKLISWFATELKGDEQAYGFIENVIASGINEVTSEMRMTRADFTTAFDTNTAYIDAANKWLGAGYTTELAVNAHTTLLSLFNMFFVDKNKIYEPIPLLNGFPAINRDGKICAAKWTPDLSTEIAMWGTQNVTNFKPMYTAFDLPALVPEWCKYLQLNKSKLATAGIEVPLDYFVQVLSKASGYEYLEIFPINISRYPQLFQV